MSSIYGFTSDVDPTELDDEELAETIDLVERDIFTAREWENGYASEVDRLETLKSDLEHEQKGRRRE